MFKLLLPLLFLSCKTTPDPKPLKPLPKDIWDHVNINEMIEDEFDEEDKSFYIDEEELKKERDK